MFDDAPPQSRDFFLSGVAFLGHFANFLPQLHHVLLTAVGKFLRALDPLVAKLLSEQAFLMCLRRENRLGFAPQPGRQSQLPFSLRRAIAPRLPAHGADPFSARFSARCVGGAGLAVRVLTIPVVAHVFTLLS